MFITVPAHLLQLWYEISIQAWLEARNKDKNQEKNKN